MRIESRPTFNRAALPSTHPTQDTRRIVPISVVFAGLWAMEIAGLESVIDKISKTAPRFTVGEDGTTIRGLGKLAHREGAHLLVMDDDLVPFPEHSIPLILRDRPSLKIVVLYSNPLNGKVASYLRAGVRAVLDRSTDEGDMPSTIVRVLQGQRFPELGVLAENVQPASVNSEGCGVLEDVRPDLLPRERKILAGLVAGKRNREIAQEINTSEQVVKNNFKRIYAKFGVKNKTELATAILVRREGNIDGDMAPTDSTAATIK